MTQLMTRRAALRGIASIPAMAGATALPVALAAATVPDPLADLLTELYVKRAEFDAIPAELVTFENEDHLVEATYGPANDRLWHHTPEPTTLRGVAEAMRYAIQEEAFLDRVAESVVKAALAFLDRQVLS
ncbi:MAG: hypothetical protein EOR88_31835 [Mesorhizobium sp.]|uniref:hypothetical protein n=2 Tax=Mesorhizobium sp. TaxID=1871066 RepID=UPI000FE86CCC|nr:hypothetical protein [Mesorhizobium sp.]RWN06685.1 MAG: hypothetical protein EOR88_31835 [Mesorhizobium sp.]